MSEPNIIVLGDTHGDHRHVIELAWRHRPDAMIHVGDFDLEQPFRQAFADVLVICPLYFVAGNHDFDDATYYDHLFHDTQQLNLHGRVVDVNGLRIAGLGGNFQSRIWYPPNVAPRFESRREFLRTCGKGNWWRDGLPLKRRGAVWPDEVENLATERADVLVTHEAPGCHRYGFQALTQLAHDLGARTIFHGHVHEQYTHEADERGVTVHGIALGGAVDLAGSVVSATGQPRR
ncbi:metallophosphoesterase [Salinisphaera sp. S4-8]|uniref:metallophosphoesterase family protein n=1 Tax=Salinisphaera sp. S4-8 TaxID=633357 RepID=UPI0033413877